MGAGAQQAYLVPYLKHVTGWSQLRASVVIACVYLSMMLFRVINLHLFRGWSDRTFTVVGSLSYTLFCVGMFAIAYVKSFALAIVFACLWGAGAALMWTGTTVQTLALADRAGGRHGTGMGTLYSSTHAGWTAGALVLYLVYRTTVDTHPQLLYVVAAGITVIGNVLATFLPAGDAASRETPSVAGIVAILSRQRALLSGVLLLFSALGYGLFLGMFTAFLVKEYGVNWILSICLYPATCMVMSFVGGKLTDRIGHAPVLGGGFLVGALGLVVTVLWRSPFSGIATGVMLGLLGSTIPVVASAIVGDAAERRRRPLAHGVIFSWRDIGVVTAAVGANILGLKFEMRAVFCVFAAVFALCAVLSYYLGRFATQRI
jgi:MFS family permease